VTKIKFEFGRSQKFCGKKLVLWQYVIFEINKGKSRKLPTVPSIGIGTIYLYPYAMSLDTKIILK